MLIETAAWLGKNSKELNLLPTSLNSGRLGLLFRSLTTLNINQIIIYGPSFLLVDWPS